MRATLLLIAALACGPVTANVIGADSDVPERGPTSCAYVGGWPCIVEALDLDEPAPQDFALAARVPRLRGVDQFGDEVDIYDFAREEPILVIACEAWVYSCRDVAAWLEGDDTWLNDAWPDIPTAAEDGRLRVIMVLSEDLNGGSADGGLVRSWYEMWPVPHVPVLADPQAQIGGWMPVRDRPAAVLLDADLRVDLPDARAARVFTELQERLEP